MLFNKRGNNGQFQTVREEFEEAIRAGIFDKSVSDNLLEYQSATGRDWVEALEEYASSQTPPNWPKMCFSEFYKDVVLKNANK